jgi:hypothetical protein
MDDASFSRPEPLYFWGYFVFLNMMWIVIPSCESKECSITSIKVTAKHELTTERIGLIWGSLHKIKEAFRNSENVNTKGKLT